MFALYEARRQTLKRSARWLLALCAGLSLPAHANEPEPSSPAKLEGAVGLVLGWSPAFVGSSDVALKPQLAGFVRYGRITITGTGGFTTRSNDEVQRGVAAELVQGKDWRINLSARYDHGRRESDSTQLRGLGNVRQTVRARMGMRWSPDPHWALTAGANLDVLGRVGGTVVDVGMSRHWLVSPSSRVIVSASVAGASRRYMQAWHGVSEEQSQASGYPRYDAGMGLRDVGASLTWRTSFDDNRWAAFVGVSAKRLVGPAASSPFTTQRAGWGLGAGMARKF